MRKPRVLGLARLSAIGGLVLVGWAAVSPSSATPGDGPSIDLSRPLPNVVRVRDLLRVAGHIRDAPARTRAALESRQSTNWTVVVSTQLHAGGAFRLRWRVPESALGPIAFRVAALSDRRTLAATAAQQEFVGPARVRCAPPTPPQSVPAGDGWIVGGLYIEGGPAPGLDQCSSSPYTVTASTSAGEVASENVRANGSYTIVLAAGRYELRAGCSIAATATVTASKKTVANTYCLVP